MSDNNGTKVRTAQEVFNKYNFHMDMRGDREYWLWTYFVSPDPEADPPNPTNEDIGRIAEELILDDAEILYEAAKKDRDKYALALLDGALIRYEENVEEKLAEKIREIIK